MVPGIVARATSVLATTTTNRRSTSNDLPSTDVVGVVTNRSPIELYRLVLNRDWDRALRRVGEYPEDAQFLDDFGLSPLHRACFRDAPVELISALIRAFPEATHLRDQCQFSGLTPLHAACHYCSAAVVRCLLKSYPSAIHMISTKGYTPLQCTCQVYEARIRHHFARIEYENSQYQQQQHRSGTGTTAAAKPWSDIFVDDPMLLRFWSVVCALLQVQVYGCPKDTNEDCSNFIVHACARASHTVPTILLELAVRLHPEQLLTPCHSTGQLPLHIALSQPSSTPQSDAVASFLFQQSPTAARYPDPSAGGIYPLIQAQCAGKSWNTFVYPLLHAYPEALYSINPSPQLLSTIMGNVATITKTSSTSNITTGRRLFSHKLCHAFKLVSEEEDAAVVSTLFGLLRENPTLMDIHGPRKSTTELSVHGSIKVKSKGIVPSPTSSKSIFLCVKLLHNLRVGYKKVQQVQSRKK